MLINLVGYFFVYSLLGWVLETIWRSVEDRRFVPSGAFGFPLCEIYGIGALAILMVLAIWPDLASAAWPFQWIFFGLFLGFYHHVRTPRL